MKGHNGRRTAKVCLEGGGAPTESFRMGGGGGVRVPERQKEVSPLELEGSSREQNVLQQ